MRKACVACPRSAPDHWIKFYCTSMVTRREAVRRGASHQSVTVPRRFLAGAVETPVVSARPTRAGHLFAQRFTSPEHAHGRVVAADARLSRVVFHRDTIHLHSSERFRILGLERASRVSRSGDCLREGWRADWPPALPGCGAGDCAQGDVVSPAGSLWLRARLTVRGCRLRLVTSRAPVRWRW